MKLKCYSILEIEAKNIKEARALLESIKKNLKESFNTDLKIDEEIENLFK